MFKLEYDIKKIKIFAILFISVASIKFLISYIFFIFMASTNASNFKFENRFHEFITVLILAPLIETYLFQHLVLSRLLKYNYLLSVVVSSLMFSLVHLYSAKYFIYAFASGLTYSVSYIIAYRSRLNPFLFVWSTHFSYNLFVFLKIL
jgi:uncharacterized protein